MAVFPAGRPAEPVPGLLRRRRPHVPPRPGPHPRRRGHGFPFRGPGTVRDPGPGTDAGQGRQLHHQGGRGPLYSPLRPAARQLHHQKRGGEAGLDRRLPGALRPRHVHRRQPLRQLRGPAPRRRGADLDRVRYRHLGGPETGGAKRIVFSNDGLVYYTEDHYESFELLYGEAEP